MGKLTTLEVPIQGMDCAECTRHVQHAIARLPGVDSVEVLLASEKAIIRLDSDRVDLSSISKAVSSAGSYSVPVAPPAPSTSQLGNFNRQLMTLLAIVFSTVLFIVVVGEWLGVFKILDELVPFPIGVGVVILGGWPVFLNVIRATLKRQIISHTLMTLGVIAALAVGEWVTAAIVVIFMRVGDTVENFTTQSARRAVKELVAIAPLTARIERENAEVELPIAEVLVGDVVVVRPGEKIPVDGEVVSGQATIDQSAITGESMPLEAANGSHVFAASIAKLGSLRVKTLRVGADTTFGRVIKMVENAEANRAEVQRFADKFSGYYLPIVTGIAALTFLISRNPLSTAAVLVVACSCSVALATPVAMLASIGGGAKRGLLIKGGKYIETLARVGVVLVDKTGTLTLGKPRITDVIPLNDLSASEVLAFAASAEHYSEHPLAEAVRSAAVEQNLTLAEAQSFEVIPGEGVRAQVNGKLVLVGNNRLVPTTKPNPIVKHLEEQGKTLLFLSLDGEISGVLAAEDTLRPDAPQALKDLTALGIERIELLTGDNQQTAANLAGKLGVAFRANLLPEDKIRIVREYQERGHTVAMVGDGINDAPALAQANVGIAMGAAGTDVALEAAHVVLMHEDWMLVPEVVQIARRTMGVVKMNLAFTALYNVVGLTLAAFGLLPPMFAAAAQSLPDIGILVNSTRLLRQE